MEKLRVQLELQMSSHQSSTASIATMWQHADVPPDMCGAGLCLWESVEPTLQLRGSTNARLELSLPKMADSAHQEWPHQHHLWRSWHWPTQEHTLLRCHFLIMCYCICATIPISAQVPLLVSYPMMDCLKLLMFSTVTRFKGIQTSFKTYQLVFKSQ